MIETFRLEAEFFVNRVMKEFLEFFQADGDLILLAVDSQNAASFCIISMAHWLFKNISGTIPLIFKRTGPLFFLISLPFLIPSGFFPE